ncbi:MAG: cytochrome B [Methylococcaceae bacterium]|nr:cytochrome B [Methylococcaceae bacterium]
MNTIRVWDLPTRIVHWSLVICFAGLFITGDSERWRDIHAWLGYTLLSLLAFRLIWGFAGSRYARFGEFVAGPRVVWSYLRSLLQPRPQHYVGHNPAGGWAILALIGTGLGAGLTGRLLDLEIGGDLFEEVHEGLANLMLAVVLVHIAGVGASSLLHRENLVRAMVTGTKPGLPEEQSDRPYRMLGVLILLAVLGTWGWLLGGAERTASLLSHPVAADDDD